MNIHTEVEIEIEETLDNVEDSLGLLKELITDEKTVVVEPKVINTEIAESKVIDTEGEHDENAALDGLSFSEMTPEQQRRYKRINQRERRAALKAREAKGSVKFDAVSTRDALADAAMLLLATGGPGADVVMNYLNKVFADQPGAPLTIRARARSGELRPKLIEFARKSS